MLSSITPLGQRGRGMSWARTVVAFWVGALISGAVVFGILGWIGEVTGVDGLNPWYTILVLVAAGLLDLAGVKPPGLHRQVDEDWLGRYRDWVVGLGFGAQLGAGFATIIPSFGTWAMLLVALSAGFPFVMLMGIAFGVGRSLLLLSTRSVRSTSSLADRMRKFNGAEEMARRVSVAGYAAVLVLVVLNVT